MTRQELMDEEERRRREAAGIAEDTAGITDGYADTVADPFSAVMSKFGGAPRPAPKRMTLAPITFDIGKSAPEEPAVDVGEAWQAPAHLARPYSALLGPAPKVDDEATRPGPSAPIGGGPPADMGLKAPESKGGPNWDRVSAALYSAFTRKPLDQSFFHQGTEDEMRAEELAQKKQHNDFLKDQLRLKYQAKGVSTDPADDDRTSDASQFAQSAVLGSKTLAPIVEKMGGEDAIRRLSANQIRAMFPAKQFSPLLASENRENNKIPVEEAKQGNRVELEGKKQEGRVEIAGHADTRAANNLAAAEKRHEEQMDFNKDKFTAAVGAKIPPETKAVYDSGQRIDSLINDLGGEGKLAGVGLISGSVPNPLVGQKVVKLRHEIMNLINTYGHTNFGGALTKDEIERLTKAVGDIKAWRSEAEVLDGVRLIRSLYKSRGDQVIGNAPAYVKDRLQRNNAAPVPDLYGPTPTGPAAPTQPGGSAPAPQSTSPAQKSPNTGAGYVKTVVKDGKRYFIDARNKIVDAIQEVTGGP